MGKLFFLPGYTMKRNLMRWRMLSTP